jgi:predicted dehydrogenase
MWTTVAIVGCGFVADYYVSSLGVHPELRLAGAFDLNPDRNAGFAAYHRVRAYPSYEGLLGDPAVDIVVNLTPPESHYEVSRRALEAGKHVYSEKPVAMRL